MNELLKEFEEKWKDMYFYDEGDFDEVNMETLKAFITKVYEQGKKDASHDCEILVNTAIDTVRKEFKDCGCCIKCNKHLNA